MGSAPVRNLFDQAHDARHPVGCRCTDCRLDDVCERLERALARIEAPTEWEKVAVVARRTGLGKDKVVDLIKRGELEAIWIDRCRLVSTASVNAFIERRREEAQQS